LEPATSNAVTLSVAMIVRDEAELLAGCLTSLADIADEVCLVDTGSRDGTPDIARRFGARVESFEWCDDFAAARNASLRLCAGRWILVLDADERIDADDAPRLRGLVSGEPDAAYRFVTRNYTNQTNLGGFNPCTPRDPNAGGFRGWTPSTKVRLFPNVPEARFEGKVHELVGPSLMRVGVAIRTCDIPIHHYPLLRGGERIRRKQEEYLRLGHEKVRTNPDDPRAYTELGNQYVEVGDYARAAAAYREAVRLDPANAQWLTDMGSALHLLKRNDEALRALELAVRRDPALAAAWRNLGVVHVDEKRWDAAEACFRRALACDRDWTEGHRYLSVALEGSGRLAEAVEASRAAVEAACATASPDADTAARLYMRQMKLLGREGEALRVLTALAAGRPCLRGFLDEPAGP